MTTLQFNTNINCGNCIKSVTPFLNALESIDAWEVDTNNPEKVLSIHTEERADAVTAEVLGALQQAGFKADVRRG
ncbi:MAG: heavy-metal-associated domain-containing protein [Bacteroidota bacterium]